MKTVSAIIPNYNYAHYLRDAVESVLAQTHKEIEIILVDDGSQDDSRKVIESYGDRIKPIFQKNQGVAAARNNGVAASSGEFIVFLDADDAWLPSKIEKQLGVLSKDKEIGLVHTGVVNVDGAGNRLDEHTNGMSGWVSEELLKFERPVILGGGSGILLSRKVFEEVGGFDTRLSTSADWDFFYRVSCLFKVGFVPEVLLKYRMHGSNMHSSIKTMESDMLLGFEKAFANGTTADRNECYSNLHRTLAGSYFQVGQYGNFIRQTIKSIRLKPSNIGYFIRFPLRQLRRR